MRPTDWLDREIEAGLASPIVGELVVDEVHALECACNDCVAFWERDHYLDCSRGPQGCERCKRYVDSLAPGPDVLRDPYIALGHPAGPCLLGCGLCAAY